MRRLILLAIAAISSLGLVVPTAPVATSMPAAPAAAAVQPLVVKTVMIGGKRVRFVLGVNADEKAFVLMKLRRDGRWRTVASDRTDCHYYDGSQDPTLEVQKPVKQVFVTWLGSGEVGVAEYGGYNVRRRTIEMYGTPEECPAAG